VHSINYFDVIKIYELFGECQLGLSGGLLKALARFAPTVSVISAISCSKLLCVTVVLSSTCDCTAPYNIEAIIINGNINILGSASLELEILVIGHWIHEKALPDWACLYAFRSLVAVSVPSTLGVLRVAVPHRATCETEPDRLCAEICHFNDSL
jgi:hypothetical protein